VTLSHEDVRRILALIDAAGPAELQIETEGFSLHVRLGDGAPGAARLPLPERPATAPAHSAPPVPPPVPVGPTGAEPPPPGGDGDHADAGAAAGEAVESPMLGTFYRAESPGAAPFVEVGSEVEADTVVCIIEVMKMMNSVTAGVAGRIVEVCADNGQLVEFGEPLFRVAPA
jgi:acetyl-CoA carboxylase biotin carboxyl carrier protein